MGRQATTTFVNNTHYWCGKVCQKASVVESLASFTEKHQSNNDAIFMGRGVTTVIIDASVLIRETAP